LIVLVYRDGGAADLTVPSWCNSVKCVKRHVNEDAQLAQRLLRDTRLLAQIQHRGLRIEHPDRDYLRWTGGRDKQHAVVAAVAILTAPPNGDNLPVKRVEAVVDRDFLTLLKLGIM